MARYRLDDLSYQTRHHRGDHEQRHQRIGKLTERDCEIWRPAALLDRVRSEPLEASACPLRGQAAVRIATQGTCDICGGCGPGMPYGAIIVAIWGE